MPVEAIGSGLGFEELTDLGTATGLADLPSGRVIALIQCAKTVDGNSKGNVAVRWRNDGTDPTADVGHELQPGESIQLCTGLQSLKFIQVASNAKVNVTYLPWSQYAVPI